MRHPLLPHLHRIQTPGRYLGGEKNAIYKETSRDTLLFALVYPELYEIGMSNLGMKVIYHVLNGMGGVYCERAFLPAPDAEEIMLREKIPLFSLETYRPLREFDVIGFSVHTELNYTNILHALRLAEVPLLSEERNERDPIVAVGGPASFNPEPIKAFADFFVVGEGEDVVLEIAEVLRDCKRYGIGRNETLRELSKVKGVFVPRYPSERVERRWALLDPEKFPTAQIVPNVRIIHDRFVVEIMRGCTRGCRFCEGGMSYRPIRIRKTRDVLLLTKRGIRETGFEDISLLAFTVSDYPDLTKLLYELKRELGDDTFISMPSLPVNAINEELLRLFREMRRFSITLAPETVSDRLRARINKNVPLEEIEKSLETAEKYGFRRVKLYFMVGLPGETHQDVEKLAILMRDLTRTFKRIRFRMSVNPFVPRPHTPFQWVKQLSIEEINDKIHFLKNRLQNFKRIEFSWHDPRKAFLEGVLGRGDEKLSQVILKAYEHGARFDDRSELFKFDAWQKAFLETGIDPAAYLQARNPEKDLPWDYVDIGVRKQYLLAELKRSQMPEFTPDCMRAGCSGCGPWFKEGYKLCREGYPPVTKTLPPSPSPPEKSKFGYILRYSKTKPASYFSELNVMTIFVRASRRAGIRLSYSSGYVPRPRMSFSPSLYLGAESETEFVYLETQEKYDPDWMRKALNGELPDGLKVECVRETTSKPEWGKLESALYRVELPDMLINTKKIAMDIAEGVVKKGGRKYRLKESVISCELKAKVLLIQVRLKGSPGINNILAAILGLEPDEARGLMVRRLKFFKKDGAFSPCEGD